MMTSTTRATYLLAELAPSPTGVTGDQIFRELLHHNDLRNSELKHYSEMRTYEVKNPTGKLYAQEIVQMDYQAPAGTFAIRSRRMRGDSEEARDRADWGLIYVYI